MDSGVTEERITETSRHSIREVSQLFFLHFFTIVGYRNNRVFSAIQILIFQRSRNNADAHILSLGYMWSNLH